MSTARRKKPNGRPKLKPLEALTPEQLAALKAADEIAAKRTRIIAWLAANTSLTGESREELVERALRIELAERTRERMVRVWRERDRKRRERKDD